jgi:pyridoxine 5-phosphate synthase
MKLGVNIDHIAVLREARRVNSPNLIEVLGICQIAKADQITIHLREDRRHIQDKDVVDIILHSSLPVNVESSINPEIIDILTELKPHRITLVPENREEVTTEGGLNLQNSAVADVIEKLKNNDIEVSLFIDPTKEAVDLSKELNSDWVEFHTGKYANIYAMLYSNLKYSHHSIEELNLSRATLKEMLRFELENLDKLSRYAKKLSLNVAAGHGLNYQNVKDISKIDSVEELNIGQSIVARSVFVGLERAIKEMIEIISYSYSKK